MKYLILEKSGGGIPVPVLFAGDSHAHMAQRHEREGFRPTSAGFVEFTAAGPVCFGLSDSLGGLRSQPERDAELITALGHATLQLAASLRTQPAPSVPSRTPSVASV